MENGKNVIYMWFNLSITSQSAKKDAPFHAAYETKRPEMHEKSHI